MSKVVISLTSVPPRFAGLNACLLSLLGQSAKIDEINLYLPRAYRRFPGAFAVPRVPSGVQIKFVEHDLGPATKVLPAVADNADTDALILFCDDDKIYHKDWAKALIESAEAHPDCAIAAIGHRVSHVSAYDWTTSKAPTARFVEKNASYRLRRAASLGLWKPVGVQGSGYVDILCGWAGCVVRPAFFRTEDFDIPDVLWTVDDVWLSGCLEKNGVPIWLENLRPALKPSAGPNDVTAFALRNSHYKGFDRLAANQKCIAYFREAYQIWGG